jgi:subtilisin family serine protease/CheY-like chemotaxis protein
MLINAPAALVEVKQVTIVHVEDEETYELALRHVLGRENIAYYRVTLLSAAEYYIKERLVAGFIVDLRLPYESPDAFESWGNFPRTPIGLIEKIRRERPDIPVVVLSNYDDLGLKALVKKGLLAQEDIFRKMMFADDASVEAVVARLCSGSDSSVFADMDPNLQYFVAAARRGYRPRATSSMINGEVAVLARVNHLEAWRTLDGVRPGIAILRDREWLVTGRIQLDRVEAIHQESFVRSLQVAERLRPFQEKALERGFAQAGFESPLQADRTGRGVVIGIIDCGCDFAHPRFRWADGSTRLLALWDQTGVEEGPCAFGALYKADRINAALQVKAPYDYLKYHPGVEAHGTHVMDIAAGCKDGAWKSGIAPETNLVFVELSTADVPWEGEQTLDRSFGDSVHFVEALEFIFRTADDRPCVINVSLGFDTGPHDGTTLVEQAIDALVNAAPNRAVVIAAGNSCDQGLHAQGKVPHEGYFDLRWKVKEDHARHKKVEVWYSGRDIFIAELFCPSGQCLCQVPLGGNNADVGGSEFPRFVVAHRHGDPNNGDNVIGIFLGPGAEGGEWRLRLSSRQVIDGSFHAWIESNGNQEVNKNQTVSFLDPNPEYTLNSIACGHESFTVGSYDDHKGGCLCSDFSGSGPTRDNRLKPDLCAPGEQITAACSCSSEPVRMTGTSMSTPVVTGFIALLLAEANTRGRTLTAPEIREILHSAVRKDSDKAWGNRDGWGRLDGR